MFKYFFTVLFVLSYSISFGQKKMSLQECENAFQQNNLQLLAESFNIDVSKAEVIQAKIWEQPYVSGELNFINPENHSFFDIGTNGQKAIAIQQLIYLGGKKKKEIDFAKNNVAIAELQFEQLLRTLRYELQQSFYDVYFSQNKANSINLQLDNLATLINTYSEQARKGNVPLKDVVRLQSLSLSLKHELLEIQKNIFAQQETLKILLHSAENIDAVANEEALNEKYKKTILYLEAQLQEKALEKNPEYLTTLQIIKSNDLMLKWQKSLATPDITLGANYDQRSGAFNNEVNLTFGIPLPFWNKNKGNIKIAEAQLSQNKLLKEQKELEVKSKISTAYNNFLFQQKHYEQSISSFQNFEIVYQGILQNFQKRNITMIEFTDFMESYNQSVLFINDIKNQVIISGENLNYLTNDNVF